MTQPHKIPMTRTVPTEPGTYFYGASKDEDFKQVTITFEYGELYMYYDDERQVDTFDGMMKKHPDALFSGPIEFTTEQVEPPEVMIGSALPLSVNISGNVVIPDGRLTKMLSFAEPEAPKS